MYITKDGATQNIADSTFPYWAGLGWQEDADRDGAPDILQDPLKRTGALAETFPRHLASTVATGALTSAKENIYAIELLAGTTVTEIAFVSGTTAGATLTHAWFTLRDADLALLGVTEDDTAASWVASTEKALDLDEPYEVTENGLYYVGIVVVGTTPPSLQALSIPAGISQLAPRLCASGTAADLVAPATALDPLVAAGIPVTHAYAWVG